MISAALVEKIQSKVPYVKITTDENFKGMNINGKVFDFPVNIPANFKSEYNLFTTASQDAFISIIVKAIEDKYPVSIDKNSAAVLIQKEFEVKPEFVNVTIETTPEKASEPIVEQVVTPAPEPVLEGHAPTKRGKKKAE